MDNVDWNHTEYVICSVDDFVTFINSQERRLCDKEIAGLLLLGAMQCDGRSSDLYYDIEAYLNKHYPDAIEYYVDENTDCEEIGSHADRWDSIVQFVEKPKISN